MVVTEKLKQRFWSKATISDSDSCWRWNAACALSGYGMFSIRNRQWRAHRVAWVLSHGTDIPPNMRVLHSCDTPPCVNPKHLFLGTDSDNMRDAFQKGRKTALVSPHLGEHHWKARLTEQQVRDIRERAKNGAVQRRLAEEFKVGRTQICAIIKRTSWRHIA